MDFFSEELWVDHKPWNWPRIIAYTSLFWERSNSWYEKSIWKQSWQVFSLVSRRRGDSVVKSDQCFATCCSCRTKVKMRCVLAQELAVAALWSATIWVTSATTLIFSDLEAGVKDQDVGSTGFSWSFQHSLQMVTSPYYSRVLCVCTYVPGVAVSFPVFSSYTLGPALMTSFYFNFCIKDLISSREE